jgi:hypothetical protein
MMMMMMMMIGKHPLVVLPYTAAGTCCLEDFFALKVLCDMKQNIIEKNHSAGPVHRLYVTARQLKP